MPIPCSHFPKKLPTECGFQNHSQPSNKAKHPSKQTCPLPWEGSWSWPGLGAAESSPAGHSKAQIVWQGLVPADRAQILWQPKSHWKQKCCLVGSNQGWHVGLLAGKHKHPALEEEGRRNWGSGNDEADQATSICCWRVARAVYMEFVQLREEQEVVPGGALGAGTATIHPQRCCWFGCSPGWVSPSIQSIQCLQMSFTRSEMVLKA